MTNSYWTNATACSQAKLGFWKCLLVHNDVVPSGCVERCWLVFLNAGGGLRRNTTKLEVLLYAMVSAQKHLSDSEFSDGLRHIATELSLTLDENDSARILQLVRDESTTKSPSSQERSVSEAPTASVLLTLTKEDINKMRVGELKEHLAGAGLNADGLKKTLVERLVTARDAVLAQRISTPSSNSDIQPQRESATILVLDHRLQELPWEGLDIMESCDSVTRMPSLELILKTFGEARSRSQSQASNPPSSLYPDIRRERISFLLNAAGDLKSTENQLGPILDSGKSRFSWRGIVGRVPEEEEMRCVPVSHCALRNFVGCARKWLG